jgi:hypothetical protein
MDEATRRSVDDSLVLLREVKAGLHNESNRELVEALDEAIRILEEAQGDGRDCTDHAVVALQLLGRGLAALPAIQRLIEMWKS